MEGRLNTKFQMAFSCKSAVKILDIFHDC